MILLYVACGNRSEHLAHPLITGWGDCSGVTASEADAMSLIRELDILLRPYAFDPPTNSIRVECHPVVPNLLRRVIMPFFRSQQPTDLDLLPVPLVVVTGLDYGEWRIVLAKGRIRKDGERTESA